MSLEIDFGAIYDSSPLINYLLSFLTDITDIGQTLLIVIQFQKINNSED